MNRRFSRRSFLVQGAIALTAPFLARARASRANPWVSTMELEVRFEINQPQSGGRYQRPYVAVWLEDASGKAVRTLSLWYQSGRGDRWLPDLRRWFNAEQSRRSADGGDLTTTTVTGPTRAPGVYSLVWDGRNDKKVLLEQGVYYVCIEAAREHGTYQLIREPLTLGAAPLTKTLTGNVEIKTAALNYRRRTA